jgi:molybdopterin-biosynthesis enzyme MoeA-like protein
MNFYVVIIGTEILNNRREDKHFKFVQSELANYSHEIFASFIIKDDKELIRKTYELVKSDPNAVLFSFGGIGSTPDDLTREIAAEVFTSQALERHTKFASDILERFGEEAYPHRIYMSDLPKGASLLHNPINNMSGFSLQERFFFVPGFPNMAHPMIRGAIEKYFATSKEKFRLTLLADTSENTLIHVMKLVPSDVELSSLPMFVNEKAMVELSLSGYNKTDVTHYFALFLKELQDLDITYSFIE